MVKIGKLIHDQSKIEKDEMKEEEGALDDNYIK